MIFLKIFAIIPTPNAMEALMCAKNRKPTVKGIVSNLSTPMPLTRKISLLLKNNTYKLLNFKNCCGHPGEPGC